MTLLGQIVAAAPNDSRHLAAPCAHDHANPPGRRQREARSLLERASTAAYVAYQRTTDRNEEADSLALLGNVLASGRCGGRRSMRCGCRCELREVADVRGAIRDACASSTASACSITASTPIPPRRAPASSSRKTCRARTDFSPFVVLAGTDKPALSAADKQLCVEGLQHGESYTVTLRAGLPSVVHETLSKSADFSIYVRDRKPFGAFLHHRLCAAAHRAARHSGHQRQHPRGRRSRSIASATAI